jgi:predicted DCC family thiol-disulfide oxidoreductase YuxK
MVDFLDARRKIEFASLKRAEERGALDAVDHSMRYRSFHLVARPAGITWSGSDALLPLVAVLLPGGSLISRSLSGMPGCRRALSLFYSTLSRLHDVGACQAAR